MWVLRGLGDGLVVETRAIQPEQLALAADGEARVRLVDQGSRDISRQRVFF